MKVKALAPLLVTVACALGAIPATAAAATNVTLATSENWSGYVASGSSGTKRFSSVSGSWVQPAATCTSGSGYAAFWVGLGGSGTGTTSGYAPGSGYGPGSSYTPGSSQTQALEQAGTEADCTSSGQAKYFAWYELVPAAPVKVSLTIKPGDHMSTRVGVSGTTVTVSLSDQTSGQSVSKTLTMQNPDTSSAEWIAEAPSSCSQGINSCSPLPLTNFGTIKFTGPSATSTDGHTGAISDPNWTATQVSLQSGAGGTGGPQFASAASASSAGATPSSPSTDGGAFTVAWSDAASSVATGGAPGAGASSGSGYGGYGGYGGGGYPGGYGGGYPGGYGGYGGYGGGGYPGAYGAYGGGYAYGS
jgi:hypothetical protein